MGIKYNTKEELRDIIDNLIKTEYRELRLQFYDLQTPIGFSEEGNFITRDESELIKAEENYNKLLKQISDLTIEYRNWDEEDKPEQLTLDI